MTLIRKIKGLTSKTGAKKVPLVVLFTSDDMGETLSIGCEELGVMYTVQYKKIIDMVARERAKGYSNGHYIIDEGEDDE